MTNREIAQEISNRIGTAPIPFDSVYSIALEIYHQLGGEESQFDSVYSILLEILPLVEDAGKPIEEVSELPEASENKDKFYRLDNGEKDIYAAKLLSSETITTNRLPDEQQIDKAYLCEANTVFYYYKGAYKIICSDGELSGYGWLKKDETSNAWWFYLTEDNAENINTNSLAYYTYDKESVLVENDNTITTEKSVDDINLGQIESDYECEPVYATYNAPESAQIGNATIMHIGYGEDYTYSGTPVTIESYNKENVIDGYEWRNGGSLIISTKYASDIFFGNVDGFISDTKFYSISLNAMQEYFDYDSSTNTYTLNSEDYSLEYFDMGYQGEIGNLYIPQLNAPDSEQVANAYLEMETHNRGNGKFYYKGEIQIREYNFETVSSDYVIGHLWETEEQYPHYYITLTNAQNVYGSNIGGQFANEDLQNYGDEIGWASTTYTLAEIPGLISYYDSEIISSQIPSTVKYQRTETIEEWGWEKIATEQYVDNAISEIPQLEAGENIEIADNKINAKGYFYDDEKKEELKAIDDILHEAGLPAGQSLGLKVSGAAGATTYTYTDNMRGAFAQIVQTGMLPGVGATYQTANGKSGVIAAIGNGTITFEETLDADNALTDEPVDYVVTITQLFSFTEGMYKYIEGDISAYNFTISGAAGATTYTYTDSTSGMVISLCKSGVILKLQNGRSAKCISVEKIDSDTGNITFDVTFDEENALNNELVVSISNKNIAYGSYSHAEGGGILGGILLNTTASGYASHAEGAATTASGLGSHAEGENSLASGEASHAEGANTTASGMSSHAEGSYTTASGRQSHAEGNETTASGEGSHTEGQRTIASGYYSHAEGSDTKTSNMAEHAEGYNNISHNLDSQTSKQTMSSIGIGDSVNSRNGFEMMHNGDLYIYGVGGYDGVHIKHEQGYESTKTLQEYIASLEARIAALENPNA